MKSDEEGSTLSPPPPSLRLSAPPTDPPPWPSADTLASGTPAARERRASAGLIAPLRTPDGPSALAFCSHTRLRRPAGCAFPR